MIIDKTILFDYFARCVTCAVQQPARYIVCARGSLTFTRCVISEACRQLTYNVTLTTFTSTHSLFTHLIHILHFLF